MSAETTKVLAGAVGHQLCDVVVIGVKPDHSLVIDWTGSTIASLLLLLRRAEREAFAALDEAEEQHREDRAA